MGFASSTDLSRKVASICGGRTQPARPWMCCRSVAGEFGAAWPAGRAQAPRQKRRSPGANRGSLAQCAYLAIYITSRVQTVKLVLANGRDGRIRTCMRPVRSWLAYPMAHVPALAATDGVEPPTWGPEPHVMSASPRRCMAPPGRVERPAPRFVAPGPQSLGGGVVASEGIEPSSARYERAALPLSYDAVGPPLRFRT
jgi:hypothetical protein